MRTPTALLPLILLGTLAMAPNPGPTAPGAPAVNQPSTNLPDGFKDIAAYLVLIAVPFGLAMFSHAALLFLLPLALLQVSGENGWALYLPAILGPAQIAGRMLWRQMAPRSKPRGAARVMFVLFLLPFLCPLFGAPSFVLLFGWFFLVWPFCPLWFGPGLFRGVCPSWPCCLFSLLSKVETQSTII